MRQTEPSLVSHFTPFTLGGSSLQLVPVGKIEKIGILEHFSASAFHCLKFSL
jgi:hypothetical protein